MSAAVDAAFQSAAVRGLGGALRPVHIMPVQKAVAFTSRTESPAATGVLADHLTSALTREHRLVLHPLFLDGKAGEIVSVGPYRGIALEEPPEHALIIRGGRIPPAAFHRTSPA